MISLLVILPVLLLFLTALGIVILRQFRPGIGYAWLIAALGGLLTVAASLFLRGRLPLEMTLNRWRPFLEASSPPALRLDLSSWPYVFCLSVLALVFILTDSARLEGEAKPFNWAGGLAMIGLGMLAVMAANPMTLILTWTAVDLVEFLMVMATDAGQRRGVQTVTAFSVRVAGTLLVILAILFSRSRSIPFDLSPIPSSLAIFMLLAAGLRLGVLPLNLSYTREVYAWRGLGNIMRMIGPASSLVVLGRMPEQTVPPQWKGLFLALSALAALYGSGMWLAADSELNGRPYWSIALAALAVSSVVNGNPMASIAWGAVLILIGSILFFYSARRKQILFIPILGVIGIIGLPFNPAAAGWLGLASGGFSPFTLLFLLALLFLIWGFVRHLLHPREELYRMERWVHTIYPTGLILLVFGQWVLGVFGWPGSLTVGVWWASVALALISALGIVLAYTFRGVLAGSGVSELAGDLAAGSPGSSDASGRWVGVFIRRAAGALGAVLRLNWLYSFITWVYQLIQYLIQLLTAVFEGDGGILWSLVMLAILISLIWTGIGGRP